MVRALLEQEQENYKARLNQIREMNREGSCSMRRGHSQSMILESTSSEELVEDPRSTKSCYSSKADLPLSSQPRIGSILEKDQGPGPRSRLTSCGGADRDSLQKDMDMMKERFAKLLLGEDMSGGGKGVSSALALSNAVTNLAASVFGEQRKLEPMAPENRSRWKKEIDWLLSVTDHIVEFVPSQQKSANGTNMEIMTTKQRTDLQMNIPALRKLDAMLIDCLDNFKDQNEFYYVAKDADEAEKGSKRDDKWWLPTVKVPTNGLSEVTKKWLQFQKDSVNQVLKAAMAINAQVLSEMEIPENYIESLPKNGRASLGDVIYKSITVEYFDPEQFFTIMDLSSEHKILDLKNRIEASVVIWRRKMTNKDAKSPWGSAVSIEKRELFEERAETILLIIKQRFPGISQSQLDISKIQFNKDVGHALLESYSRILESLAHTVLSRIEDVLYADSLAQNPSLAQKKRNPLADLKITSTKFPNADEEIEKLNAVGTPPSMTLSDFMGWTMDNGEADLMRAKEGVGNEELKDTCDLKVEKLANISIPKKVSYLETLGGLRSPTSRH
ncbi:rop guanine nucleotide exchange factor 12-like [Spinacia oleracea]|uniref:Rop guanine nucleotide exchange factor 12-like n=1 Tax=Spinacia oleracea TaxID=3562 RepID=A0A9R0J931_SPIOL|nr:rop guanine nucleotide exchange factor 12-like [Spinacia oleracea]